MSLIPLGTASFLDINHYASVQVAVTCAALYDHALSFGREVELIWMKPPTQVSLLYIIERYLGDVVLVMLFDIDVRTGVSNHFWIQDLYPATFSFVRCIRLFQFRAWGALAYSWATQATMVLRLYAMYRQSRQILILMITLFLCEIVTIAFIIWRTIGPRSPLQAIADAVPGERFCAFSGINDDFMYIFIPFLCFEFFLFVLAARVFIDNVQRNKKANEEKGVRVNPFMSVLARDSLCYFFVNLVACAVVMGLWRSVTELYANMCIPFVMFLEVLVGTRLILDFRERYARSGDPDHAFSGRYSSLHFRDEDGWRNSLHVLCETETIVVTDSIV